MAALLVGLSIVSLMLSVAMPAWHTIVRREREADLIFRGEQYARAIALFQRTYAGTFPPTIDVLLEGRFLRRRYVDPMTNGAFQLIYADLPVGRARLASPLRPGMADRRRGIVGVVSRSPERSLRQYNGRGRYDEWMFVAISSSLDAGRVAEVARPSEENGDRVGGARRVGRDGRGLGSDSRF